MEQSDVIAAAEGILTRRFGGAQELVDATRLPGSGLAGCLPREGGHEPLPAAPLRGSEVLSASR